MRTFSVLLLLLAFPAGGGAGERTITLKELEQAVITKNPAIRMAEGKTRSAEEQADLADGMPDPMIGFSIRNSGWFDDITIGEDPMSMAGITITQAIPFPGKLSTKGRAARRQAERVHENERQTRLRVLRTLRTAYYEYYLAYASSDILNRNKEIMKNVQRIAETRYATGRGIQQDVLRAQLEVSMILEKIAREEQKKEKQRATINSLLGRNPFAPLGKPADVLPTSYDTGIEALSGTVQDTSPILQAHRRTVEQREEELSLSRKQYLPDMVVTAGWFDREDAFNDIWTAGIMFKIPLYFWNTSSGVKAAAADLGSSRHEYEAARLDTLSRVKDLYTRANTSERLLSLYTTGILPQAQMALRSATSSYQVGKIDFLALLDSQTLLLRYQLAYEKELVDLNKTISEIEEMTGMGETIHEQDSIK